MFADRYKAILQPAFAPGSATQNGLSYRACLKGGWANAAGSKEQPPPELTQPAGSQQVPQNGQKSQGIRRNVQERVDEFRVAVH